MRRAVGRAEAAEMYDVHVNDITRAIHAGKLPAKKVGKRYRIATDDLEAWFASLPDA